MRVAVLGGSFNPIHNGHVAIARSILQQDMADQVWLMVTPCNPWKTQQNLLDNAVRLEMADIASAGMENVRSCDFEFHMPVPNYTVNTLRALSSAYPDCVFKLAVGADNWDAFHEWREWDYILSHYGLIVYPREGCRVRPAALPQNVSYLDCQTVNVSSTDIRRLLARGKPVEGLVPDGVARYIAENNLYING